MGLFVVFVARNSAVSLPETDECCKATRWALSLTSHSSGASPSPCSAGRTLHVRDGSGFNFLREAKIPTELANFADVELDQQDLLVSFRKETLPDDPG